VLQAVPTRAADYLLVPLSVCRPGSRAQNGQLWSPGGVSRRRPSKSMGSGFTVRAGDRRQFGQPACLVAHG